MQPPSIFGFSPSTPAAPSGRANTRPKTDGAFPLSHYSFDMPNVGGTLLITGTTDTLDQSRQGLLTRYSSASAVAVSIATPTDASWIAWVNSSGAGAVTFTPAAGNINGGATFVLSAGSGAIIWWDGANYEALVVGGTGTTTGSAAPFNQMLSPSSVTPPVLASLTWGNQGTATAAANAGGALYVSASGTGTQELNHLYKAAPATPWTLTIGACINVGTAANTPYQAGIALRESGTGKIIFFSCGDCSGSSSGPEIGLDYETNYSTFSSHSVGPIQTFSPPVMWMQVTDNGTNLIFRTSIDGQNWKQFASQSRTAFFTTGPDQAGIAVLVASASASVDAVFVHFAGI